MYISKICDAIVLVLLYVLTHKGASCERGDYTNTWAIQTDSEESAKRIAKRYNFVYGGKIGALDGYFLLVKKSVPRRRRRSTLYTSSILSLDPAVFWSQQQRILKRVKRRFTDKMYPDQWYLENNVTKGHDINVVPVWKQGITGRGVIVTILDDGIEHKHPDLKKNYDKKASYDFNDEDPDPLPRYTARGINKHGTRCAGEVAAVANNKVCGVGVAYNARIGGIRMLDGDVTDAVEARSLGYVSNYIDIYSSSWGPEDKGVKVDGPGRLARDALKNGATNGRAGKGSIFVWATGNGGDYNDYCNCDGYITSIYTISIGAVNDMGKSPWYAEPCPSTLAVTYSSGQKGENSNKKIATTDIHQTCTKAHTGTSAAAPLAAGIFALVLEANPALTWRDLQHLIVETSRVTDSKDSDWLVNGAGYHVNNKYGFGLLDAAALVRHAKEPGWETASPQHMCRGNEKIDARKIQAMKIFRSTIFTDGCVHLRHEACVTKLEHVIVYISLRHERRGALEINLISPSGMKSKLLGLRKLDHSNKGFRRWPFMTVFHWGEKPRGIWTLEIKNMEDLSGDFERWHLKLYGTCALEKNTTAHEKNVCSKYCRKGCPQEFATVCPHCVQLCDCTSGKCTKRCPRGLETDLQRNECTNSSAERVVKDNKPLPERTAPVQSQSAQQLPKYGQWLLVAAGVAVTLGIVAGIWQGWLYYKTRKKLNKARKQNQVLRFPIVPQNTIVKDLEHARLTSVKQEC